MYIRSVLEYNSNVWFSAITNEEKDDIERVQRVACKIILRDQYTGYSQALETLNLQSLSDRRQSLAKRFALKCVKNEKFKDLFPLNPNDTDLRSGEKYLVKFAKTNRLQKSTIPALQKILNRHKWTLSLFTEMCTLCTSWWWNMAATNKLLCPDYYYNVNSELLPHLA